MKLISRKERKYSFPTCFGENNLAIQQLNNPTIKKERKYSLMFSMLQKRDKNICCLHVIGKIIKQLKFLINYFSSFASQFPAVDF